MDRFLPPSLGSKNRWVCIVRSFDQHTHTHIYISRLHWTIAVNHHYHTHTHKHTHPFTFLALVAVAASRENLNLVQTVPSETMLWPTATAARIQRTLHSSSSATASRFVRKGRKHQTTTATLGNGCDQSSVIVISSSSARFFSSNQSNNNNNNTNIDYQYQYPSAKEAPEVTRTTAAQAKQAATATTSTMKKKHYGDPNNDTNDPFDDAGTLSELERERLRQEQAQRLQSQVQLSRDHCFPILSHSIPAHIPPNVPDDQLVQPQTRITTLDNGIRVVSQESYGQVSTLGAVCRLGSRYENQLKSAPSNYNAGVCSILEGLILLQNDEDYNDGTDNSSSAWLRTAHFLSNTSREQSLFCVDLLRPNVDQAVAWLGQRLLQPAFMHEASLPSTLNSLEQTKRACLYQSLNLPPELWLLESLQKAAYGPDQQLGKAHFLSIPSLLSDSLSSSSNSTFDPSQLDVETQGMAAVEHLTPSVLTDFWQQRVLEQPTGLVIAAAGVQHDNFVDLVQTHFGHLPAGNAAGTAASNSNPQDSNASKIIDPYLIKSVYRGGEYRQEMQTMDGLVRVAVAVPIGGWYSDDLVPACVLQTLLGGGSSFSAGGPGKGMYSRLYRQVLNRYSWVESAEAVTSFHDECGLLVLTGTTSPNMARDMVSILAEHIARLSHELVTDEELSRARNMLKNNVLTQLESRVVLFEDLGRQVLTYGQREDVSTTCRKIEAVTSEDIHQLLVRALTQNHPVTTPTIASVGPDLTHVPSHDEVARWLGSTLG